MYIVKRIDKERAAQLLAAPPRPLAKKRTILKIDLFYLPHFVFDLRIQQKDPKPAKAKICVEGLEGVYGIFNDANMSNSPEEPSRIIKSRITVEQAEKSGLEEFRRYMLRFSLKKKDKFQVLSCKFEQELYYPYWVGYFKRQSGFDFEAIDGLSGQRQGVKMKPVFMKAILANKEGR